MQNRVKRVIAGFLMLVLVFTSSSVHGTAMAASQSKSTEIVKNWMASGMSEAQKAYILYEYIITNISYDYVGEGGSQDGEAVLKRGFGVCEGFSNAYKLLCNKAGITCEIVIGKMNMGSYWAAHAWNKVKLDGKWYNFDPTNFIAFYPTSKMKEKYRWNNSKYEKQDGNKYNYYQNYVWEGKNPVAIRDSAFQSEEFSSFTIPSTVKKIGKSAFTNCEKLKKITIPKAVKEIGEDAFSGCTKLTEVTIPKTTKYIGYGAFMLTPWLEKNSKETFIINDTILMHEDVKEEVLRIPEGIKTVAMGAPYITETHVPETVSYINSEFFEDIEPAPEEKFLVVGNGVLVKYTGNDSTVTIPDSVKVIGNNVFEGNTKISKVVLPENLSAIESYAFSECKNLKEISIPSSCKKIGERAFQECTSLSSLTLESGVEEIEPCAFYNTNSLKKVVIPGTVKIVEEDAFCGYGLEEVVVKEGVEELAHKAFGTNRISRGSQAVTKLKKVTLPKSLKTMSIRSLPKNKKITIICKRNTTAFHYGKGMGMKVKVK